MRPRIVPPSRKKLITFAILWFIGLVLIVLAATDFFREPLFQRKNFSMLFTVLLSPTVMLLVMFQAYRKNKRQDA